MTPAPTLAIAPDHDGSASSPMTPGRAAIEEYDARRSAYLDERIAATRVKHKGGGNPHPSHRGGGRKGAINDADVLAAIPPGGATVTTLRGAVGFGENAVRNALARLERRGQVRRASRTDRCNGWWHEATGARS